MVTKLMEVEEIFVHLNNQQGGTTCITTEHVINPPGGTTYITSTRIRHPSFPLQYIPLG